MKNKHIEILFNIKQVGIRENKVITAIIQSGLDRQKTDGSEFITGWEENGESMNGGLWEGIGNIQNQSWTHETARKTWRRNEMPLGVKNTKV